MCLPGATHVWVLISICRKKRGFARSIRRHAPDQRNPMRDYPKLGYACKRISFIFVTRSLYTGKHERLCALLVEARDRAHLTQAQLAAKIGRPQSFVSKYERGERRLDVIEFLEVAQALEASPAGLITKLLRGA